LETSFTHKESGIVGDFILWRFPGSEAKK